LGDEFELRNFLLLLTLLPRNLLEDLKVVRGETGIMLPWRSVTTTSTVTRREFDRSTGTDAGALEGLSLWPPSGLRNRRTMARTGCCGAYCDMISPKASFPARRSSHLYPRLYNTETARRKRLAPFLPQVLAKMSLPIDIHGVVRNPLVTGLDARAGPRRGAKRLEDPMKLHFEAAGRYQSAGDAEHAAVEYKAFPERGAASGREWTGGGGPV